MRLRRKHTVMCSFCRGKVVFRALPNRQLLSEVFGRIQRDGLVLVDISSSSFSLIATCMLLRILSAAT